MEPQIISQKSEGTSNTTNHLVNISTELTTPQIINTPPKPIIRNEYGLLEHIDYIFDEDGYINWRKMVSEEFLVPNIQKTKETDVSKLADSELLILLGGLKTLAQIRGFSRVSYENIVVNDHNVTTICRIVWLPTYETENREIVFESIGSATTETTTGFGKNYLAEMAENRAFCRNVRNFLRINILSREELNIAPIDYGTKAPKELVDRLQRLSDKTGVSFEKIKNTLAQKYQDDPAKYPELAGFEAMSQFEDIPPAWINKFIKKLNEIKNAPDSN